MTYEIIIKQTFTEVQKKGKDWKVIGVKDGENEFGYTPLIEKEVVVSYEVYKQIVNDLDLVAVIDAINKPLGVKVKGTE